MVHSRELAQGEKFGGPVDGLRRIDWGAGFTRQEWGLSGRMKREGISPETI